jgi:hypothetical protein
VRAIRSSSGPSQSEKEGRDVRQVSGEEVGECLGADLVLEVSCTEVRAPGVESRLLDDGSLLVEDLVNVRGGDLGALVGGASVEDPEPELRTRDLGSCGVLHHLGDES